MPRFIVTLENFAPVPPRSIYRGAGKVDFFSDKLPEEVKERLAELDDQGQVVFRKPGFNDAIPSRPPRGRP